jgi:multidrug efflux pump subunit AcrA (membrane-fusion protein)
MKRFVRMVLVLVLVGLLAGGGYWLYTREVTAQSTTAAADDGSYTQIVTATLGDLSATVTVVGQMEAVRQSDLSFKLMSAADRLLTLNVTAGNTVKAGDVLATISAETYQQEVDQAQSDLQAAEEKLADLQVPATELEIAQADLKIAQVEQDLAQAQADLADLGETDLTDLQAAVTSAQNDQKLAELELQAAQRDSLAKSERGLQYAIAWKERRINELQDLVAHGQANVEQTEELTTEQSELIEAQADLGRVQAERTLSLRSAEAAVAKAKVGVSDAHNALAEAQTGDELELAEAQLNIKNAELALLSAEEARADLATGADATDLAAAQADVDKKQLALNDAQAALEGMQLIAPFDGTVLQTHVQAGDKIAAATNVLTLANLNELQVMASIGETTIKRVAAGQPASVTFDALPGTTLTGLVGEIPLQGALSGGVMTYDVPIRIQGAEDLPLLVGMTANVVIQTGSVQNALLIPTMALTKSGGMYTVQVRNTLDPAGAPESVPVEVGLSDGTYTQIVRGLVEGDQVLVTLSASDSSFRGFGGLTGGGMMSGGTVRRIDR